MSFLKKYLEGFYMALGMFTAIPLPFHLWKEKHTSIMITFFPLVGLIVGVVWWLVSNLLFAFGIPHMLAAVILTVIPFFIAGFIHLDGYMDTSDALLSYRTLEDKLQILKDPNVGAFAVVMLVIVLFMQFGAVHGIAQSRQYLFLMVGVMVISRCCAALSIFFLPHNLGSNYAPLLAQGVAGGHKVFVVLIKITALALSFSYAGYLGIIVLGAVLIGYSLAMLKAIRGFKGISGDLLGFALIISECCGFIALAVMQGR